MAEAAFANRTAGLPPPTAIVFDWHGTLVNTLDAMYLAIEHMLPRLEELGLVDRLASGAQAQSHDDEKLIRYIRIFRRLHPRVLAMLLNSVPTTKRA